MNNNLTPEEITTLKDCLSDQKKINEKIESVLTNNPTFMNSSNGLHLDKSKTQLTQSLELLTFEQ